LNALLGQILIRDTEDAPIFSKENRRNQCNRSS
jgi:hypothetical protein